MPQGCWGGTRTKPGTTPFAGHARATRGSIGSKALGKHAFYVQVDLPQDKAYAYAIEVMAAAALTPDGQEGIAAFLEKRKPEFGAR